jgi:hypothetical protein
MAKTGPFYVSCRVLGNFLFTFSSHEFPELAYFPLVVFSSAQITKTDSEPVWIAIAVIVLLLFGCGYPISVFIASITRGKRLYKKTAKVKK